MRTSWIAGLLFLGAPLVASAEPATRVYLNGRPSPVYFNDGDSFRVLGGTYFGGKARLAGFNTLESFGPVHIWGDWHAKELYAISKMATHNGANGVWRCTSDMSTDTYGRTLWFCPDLALDQVRRGFAHVLSIDENPGDPKLLEAQLDAQKNRRGMWAHGVPGYILTSLHSMSEGGKDGKQYNRFVSTRDGHSASIAHSDTYDECQKVCFKERPIPAEVVTEIVKRLTTEAPELVEGESPERVFQIVEDYGRIGFFVGVKDEGKKAKLEEKLGAYRTEGAFGQVEEVVASCHIYVAFERRYGGKRAECLK
ncbi:MAG: thermonuclease family protein [Deltaproteobacteria bacterium]|nr:thermonuclease family protein [Deltaproteobacteria bacterium]